MAVKIIRNKPPLVVKWEHIEIEGAKQRIRKAYELLLADLNNPQAPFDNISQNRHDLGRKSKS